MKSPNKPIFAGKVFVYYAEDMPLHWKIIIGLIAGVLWAVISGLLGLTDFTLKWINPWGTVFINLLKLIAVPLVLFSIIKGIATLPDTRKLGRLGLKTLLAYLLTTVMAVTLGLLLVNIIKPGTFTAQDQRIRNRITYELWAETHGIQLKDDERLAVNPEYQAIVDEIRSAGLYVQTDETIKEKVDVALKTRESSPLQFLIDIVPSNIFSALNDNSLMLQVIFFALFFGITLLYIPEAKATPVIQVVDGINEVFLKMVDIVMQAAPFFVFALMAGKIAEMAGDNVKNIIEIFKGLASYSVVVIAGLGLMIFGIYPLIIKLFVPKMGIKDFLRGIGPAQLLAFSTSSSAATLPVTMDCVRENLGVSREITSFVLPIGATVNMDGTSMYQAIAVVFLAQFHMVDLNIAQQLTIVLTATLASIGAAAVPSAGLVMMIIVLTSVGLPPEWIAIIFPVDRLLDMCRTVVNVTGDATVATLIASTEGELYFKHQDEIKNFEI